MVSEERNDSLSPQVVRPESRVVETTPEWLALTRDDLATMAAKFEAENKRPRQKLAMLAGIGSLVGGGALAAVAESAGVAGLSPVFFAAGWAAALGCFALVALRERRLRAEYQVRCPNCDAELVDGRRTELAIATGNCPACGQRVFR